MPFSGRRIKKSSMSACVPGDVMRPPSARMLPGVGFASVPFSQLNDRSVICEGQPLSPQMTVLFCGRPKRETQGNLWPLPRAALFTTSAPQHTNLRALRIFSGSAWWVHGECGCKTGRRLQFLWPLGLSYSVPSPSHASRSPMWHWHS